jgi:uncharacterized protein GlcG (DUF336 family)
MKLKANLPLIAARKIVTVALETGRREGLQPLTVAVLDTGGHLIAFEREDGSGILRSEIAIGKAWGALGMGASSRATATRLAERPIFLGALAAASAGRFVPVPGGVLVVDGEGEAIGAVGISGDGSAQDEFCAIAGIQAAGYAPDPAEPDTSWRGAGG